MKHIDGIYEKGNYFWTSKEWFAKQGEVRMIDSDLYFLAFSIYRTRYWWKIEPDYGSIHKVIEARCALKKVKNES